MATKKKSSSVIVARAKKTIALPPCTLGFCHLETPDDYDPDKPQYKMNAHYDPKGIQAFIDMVGAKVLSEAALEKLAEEMVAGGAGKAKKPPVTAQDFVEDKLKEPKDKAKIQLPHIILGNAAFYMKQGERTQRQISVWDAKNNVLDLKSLKLGMGSIVQPIVYPNLYYSKLNGFAAPSLKLVGVRVLKLVKYGGQQAPSDTDDEAIRDVMGDGFEYDDLSSFAEGAGDASPPAGDDVDPKDMF